MSNRKYNVLPHTYMKDLMIRGYCDMPKKKWTNIITYTDIPYEWRARWYTEWTLSQNPNFDKGRSRALVLDHIVPIKYGEHIGIPIEAIGSIENLRMIKNGENAGKASKMIGRSIKKLIELAKIYNFNPKIHIALSWKERLKLIKEEEELEFLKEEHKKSLEQKEHYRSIYLEAKSRCKEIKDSFKERWPGETIQKLVQKNRLNMLTDDSLMPFGKYQGKRMEDVPDSYLLWLHENADNLQEDLKAYIEDNMDAIKQNIKIEEE